MKRLAILLTMILILSGCDGFGFNHKDTVQSLPDFGQSLIEENLWSRWLPVRRGDPTLYLFVLKIDRNIWKVTLEDLEVNGTVSWNENRIVFHDTTGDIQKDCNRDGTYVYEIKLSDDGRTVLNLLVEFDPCPRMGYLSGWWFKVDSDD